MIVYKITNLTDGKIYVGKTTRTLNERMIEHLRGRPHSLIDAAIMKQGIENFRIEVIAECDLIDVLNELEKYWIRKLECKFPNGYNLIGYNIKPHKPTILKPIQRFVSNIVIDRAIITAPIFDKIYMDLKQKIESGEFPFHSLFPSESVLTARYGCARNTVRRALAMLIDAGYI